MLFEALESSPSVLNEFEGSLLPYVESSLWSKPDSTALFEASTAAASCCSALNLSLEENIFHLFRFSLSCMASAGYL